ncbi:unnamed protein product [Rotaria sp. Silwood2]|nr:unnamed protein product [Rotaria sp. Silwood2]CAF4484926.1 unnamed protein product [Rotaria sp. Silwood2]
MNQSAMNEFNEELNSQANFRKYLNEFTVNLPVITIDSIKLQLSTLIHLTQTTNQLTRKTLMMISLKCYQLSEILHSLSTKIPYEDVQISSQQLLQCAANVLTKKNYAHFIDNQQTSGHQTLIFGLRELNSIEMNNFCSNLSNNKTCRIPIESVHFTLDYQMRIFSSDCYYLNEQNQWKSDKLIIERVFLAANEEEKKEFSYILSKEAFHSLSDGHFWFSIFSRPPSNQFTRVQRCTCCFVLLFVSMLSNIMYYDLSNEAKVNNSTSLSFGTFSITFNQLLIGLMSELISLIPGILLIQIFRRLRSHHQRISPLAKVFHQIKPTTKIVKKRRNFIFGNIFLHFFGQKSTNEEDEQVKEYLDENQLVLNQDEEYLHRSIENRPSFRPNRLTSNEIACARQLRLRELQIWSIVRKIFVNICFLSLLSIIVYSNHNETASFQVQHLRKSFHHFQLKILSINEYWNWLEEDFIENLRAQKCELHLVGWTDQQTRLIEIQMSLYNPNVQLFTFVTLQTEFHSTGSIHFQSRFEPIHFYGNSFSFLSTTEDNSPSLLAFTSLLQLISIIIYLILILYFIWNEIQSILELK